MSSNDNPWSGHSRFLQKFHGSKLFLLEPWVDEPRLGLFVSLDPVYGNDLCIAPWVHHDDGVVGKVHLDRKIPKTCEYMGAGLSQTRQMQASEHSKKVLGECE